MGQAPPQRDQARTALPSGLRPLLDTLHTPPAPDDGENGAPPGLEHLRRHLADYAPATRRAYLADWTRWARWCRANDRTPLPAAPADAALYLAQAHDTHHKGRATLQRWASAIATAHTANGHPDPTRRPPALDLLRWLRRCGPQPRRRTSRWLTDTELTRVLATTRQEAWPELAINRRNRLALLLARATGYGPEEVLALRAGQLTIAEGTAVLAVPGEPPRALAAPLPAADWATCLPCSLVLWRQVLDPAQDGKQALHRTFAGAGRTPPSGHLDHTLAAPADPHAWLLRRVRRGGSVTEERMAAKALRDVLRAHAERAGVVTTGLTAFALRPRP
ncbi:hypothetical protein [Nocardiopsis sp. LOL_012]|uniref:hypothetical protein n=1 Tax=Nocardiopsis sp. LOL_012 TaxID=3345409 RepID=UPI003A895E53